VTLQATATHDLDVDFVQRCLEGEPCAVKELRAIYSPPLKGFLLCHDASEIEADEMLAALWSDCLVGSDSVPPLLQRYSGTSPLHVWLQAVLFNRWVSNVRRSRAQNTAIHSYDASVGMGLELGCLVDMTLDTAVMETVETAVRAALSACKAEEIVLLQLVHMHEITRRELSILLGVHESQLSRKIKGTEKKVANLTLHKIKELDPLLELTWEDFLQACESTNLLRH